MLQTMCLKCFCSINAIVCLNVFYGNIAAFSPSFKFFLGSYELIDIFASVKGDVDKVGVVVNQEVDIL